MRGLVGHADGERGSVSVGINGYARDIQFAEAANQADGDFAAISDQDLAEHKGPIVAGLQLWLPSLRLPGARR